MLPTGCSANICYENPNAHDSDEGLIPVDCLVIDKLERLHYPDAESLMRIFSLCDAKN
jgi:hypothetical protein